jgi:dihydrofolate reductase
MICIIAAMDKNRVIGKDNKLPWRISDDLKNFKKLTTGNTVIMGRKTFESIGRPLPDRNNVVISTSMSQTAGIDVCNSFEESIMKAKSYGKDIFIIGGAAVYEQAVPLADKMYISYVKGEYNGDVFFPEFEEKEWHVEKKEEHAEFELLIYVRKHAKS